MSLRLEKWAYRKGLHQIGNGSYAYLQPDGSWGWSNAGLVVDGEESLLVDTLFDLRLTHEMLDSMRAAEPKAVTTSSQPSAASRLGKPRTCAYWPTTGRVTW